MSIKKSPQVLMIKKTRRRKPGDCEKLFIKSKWRIPDKD
jgi:hypothetical protein